MLYISLDLTVFPNNMAAQNYLFLLTLSLAVSFSSAVQILGGDPLSSEASHFNPIDHPKPPSALWGTVEGPYPTNNWWGNVILDNGDQTINILPFLAKVLDDGLHICLPGKVRNTSCFILDVKNYKEVFKCSKWHTNCC